MYFQSIFRKNIIFFWILHCIFFIIPIHKSYSINFCKPYIQRVTLHNYGIDNNNFSMVQSKENFIYICNSNGVLQYDGKNWTLIKVNGARAISIGEDNRIYVGAYNQFGVLSINQSKSLVFTSLIDSSNKPNQQIGQIKRVFSYKDFILFCSEKVVYKWDGKNISILKEGDSLLNLFEVNEYIYLFIQGKGLFRLLGDTFEQLPSSSFFADKEIIDILPYDNQLLVKTRNESDFFIVDNLASRSFSSEVVKIISNYNYTSGCQLENGNYAIGTEKSGIFIVDKLGKIISHIPQQAGLLNECINYLFVDRENNLWALHYAGLSRIEYPSAYCYYDNDQGINGKVTDIIIHNNIQYIATNKGLYYQSKNSSTHKECFECPTFLPVNGSLPNNLRFHVLENRLYVSNPYGIYEIIENKIIPAYSHINPLTISLQSSHHPGLVFIGTKNGVFAVKYVNGSFLSIGKINGISQSVINMAEDTDGTLWLTCKNNDLYSIYPFDEFNSDLSFDYFAASTNVLTNPDWISLFATHSGVLFSTSKGVFRYNKTASVFYPDSLFNSITENGPTWVFPIMEDYNQNLWVNLVDQKTLKNKTLIIEYKNGMFSSIPLNINRNNDFLITSMHSDSSGFVWIGGLDRLVNINTHLSLKEKDSVFLFFNRIKINQDSVIYNLYSDHFATSGKTEFKPIKIDHTYSTISFEFTSPEFTSENLVQFCCILDGHDKTWTDWSTTHAKEYKNLHEGKYTFRVKAKNIFGIESPEINFRFVVRPPFYRSTLAYIIYILFITFIVLVAIRWRAYYFARERFKLENIINERTEEVVIQKEKAENLLDRVLPKTTATELKSGKKPGPYHYNMVTVLFSDIQGFTKISEQLDSEMLIDELDKFFLKFDSVVDKFNIEKIKTIGDAYMCAGGIPEKNRTNPVEVVLAAIEMQNYMKHLKHEKGDGTQRIWDLRIGIDTGPVVAGVLGKSKITYDIWGGTVNTASRMEAAGEPGKINVTENTYLLIKEFFICQYRGKMPVKHKGELDMYFVESFMPHLASDIKGLYPNENFFTQLQLLRLNDIEEFILTKLEEGLPKNLYYHNIKHTIDVVTQVELIGRSEKVSDDDMLALKTAALFHDMGHLVNYDTHEEESVKLARKILPAYYYTEKQIEKIARLITCTQMPPKPTDLLEQIMCDADLDYLGRTDFVPVSVNLFKEMKERGKIESLHEWNNHQIKFIQSHQYFTQTARKLREVNKNKQLEIIRTEIRKALDAEEKG
jgi:adenylate cyclase